jgi:hypothetical protein
LRRRGGAEAGLCSQSGLVLLDSYAIDDDWHKAVIDTTKLATLAEEATPTI